MPVLILHSTESDAGSANAVAGFLRSRKVESHTVFDPATGDHVRLLPWSTPAKALLNLAGGVETNRRGGVYQVEVVGRAAEVPGYDDAWYSALAGYVRQVCAETGTPLVFPCGFVPYPQSYGQGAAQRLSFDEWLNVSGVIGHQHVPENSHGDPGDLSRLVAMLTEDALTPEQQAHIDWRFGLVEQYLTESEARTAQRIVDSETRQNTALLAAIASVTGAEPGDPSFDTIVAAVKAALREGVS